MTTRAPGTPAKQPAKGAPKVAPKPSAAKSPAKRAARTPKPKVAKSATHVDDLLSVHREVAGKLPTHAQSPVPQFDGSELEIGRHTLYVRTTGPRSVEVERQAVYVHGLGGSARNWTDLMYLLSPVAAGIAPDLLGFGRTPMPADRDYSQAAHANAVIQLIEQQCDQPIDLFGNSMGGAIAVRIAAQRPDLVRSLVLVSPALPNLRPRPGSVAIAAMTTPGVRVLYERLTGGPVDAERAVDRMHSMCYADPNLVWSERRELQIEETRWRLNRPNANEPLRLSARGLVKQFLPGRPGYIWSLAERIECPTLVIFGTHDKLVDPRLALRAAKSFHYGRIVTMPDMGHVAQLEAPETVARMVLTMWAETHA